MADTTNTGASAMGIVGDVFSAMGILGGILPAGGLADFLKNPIGSITTMIKGKTYQIGQYRLGERFMRHILQQNISGYADVPDQVVPAAQQFFTMALGVDINNDEDLQSLYSGVSAYKARPDKTGIPDAAIQRAVQIMKYWPLYNPQNTSAWYVPWPLSVIYSIDSDPSTMSYFSKLINVQQPQLLKSQSGDTNIKGVGASSGKFLGLPWYLWLLIAGLATFAIIFFIKHKNK